LTAHPVWLPRHFPATLIVTAAPDGLAASSLPDPHTPLFGELAGDGLHAVVADDQGDHRFWLRDSAEIRHAAILIPLGEHFYWRMRSAMRLKRRLDRKPSGPWPREQRLSHFQLHRAALMLRAWDGVESGATRRHVASVLLNRDVVTLRAIDWKNAPERRQLGRILAAAREHIENGYMRWLIPRTSRSARDTERD
jgi:hypothetical protein